MIDLFKILGEAVDPNFLKAVVDVNTLANCLNAQIELAEKELQDPNIEMYDRGYWEGVIDANKSTLLIIDKT